MATAPVNRLRHACTVLDRYAPYFPWNTEERAIHGKTEHTYYQTTQRGSRYIWFPEGHGLPLHAHDVDEVFKVLGGTCVVEMRIHAGQSFTVPKNTPHRVKAEGVDGLVLFGEDHVRATEWFPNE